MIPSVIAALGTIPEGLIKGREDLENKDWRDHPDGSIKVGQNTEKSSEDLKKLAVTQTRVKNHQLMLVRKLSRSNNNNNYCLHGVIWFQTFLFNEKKMFSDTQYQECLILMTYIQPYFKKRFNHLSYFKWTVIFMYTLKDESLDWF